MNSHLLVCLIVQNNHPTINSSMPNNFHASTVSSGALEYINSHRLFDIRTSSSLHSFKHAILNLWMFQSTELVFSYLLARTRVALHEPSCVLCYAGPAWKPTVWWMQHSCFPIIYLSIYLNSVLAEPIVCVSRPINCHLLVTMVIQKEVVG